MTYIEKFREDSNKGGFNVNLLSDAEMLLSPKSFRAAGKVRRWEDSEPVKGQCLCSSCTEALRSHKAMMILFMTYLADNKSIEEALGELK